MLGFGKPENVKIETAIEPPGEAFVTAIEAEFSTQAADAALAEMDVEAAPKGPCILVIAHDESIQFFPYNPETDVIAFGKQSDLIQIALADVQQIELGMVE